MARRLNLTKEQIFDAANEIAAEQDGRVTLEALRRRIGGSYNTLSPALHEWRAHQQQAAVSTPGGSLPEPLQQQMLALGESLWQTVQQHATQRLESERKALSSERSAMEAARTEMGEAADRQAQRADDLEQRCGSLEEQIQALRAERDGALQAQAQAEAQASAQRQVADELRTQLAETRQSLCADLVARVDALERDR